jgi:hypothetical protein
MAYAPSRSAVDSLNQGMVDGKYRQVNNSRGGVIDPATEDARRDLCDVFYGLHERAIKTLPAGGQAVTPTFCPTAPATPSTYREINMDDEYNFPLMPSGLGPPGFGTAMARGYQSGRGPMSPGLEAQSERWTQMSQAAGTQPHSVQQQLSPSPIAANLSAPSQQGRLLRNGMILNNTANAASSGTADTENFLHLDVNP